MNAKLRKLTIDQAVVNMGWSHVRTRLEIEAVNHIQTCLRQTEHLLEMHGAHGRYSYSASALFDLGYGHVAQLPEVFTMPENRDWVVDIFCVFSISVREVNGFVAVQGASLPVESFDPLAHLIA